ncbi:TadE/TadG family type IV pilus assembly protein [Phytoactinopolyspora endophytica]|uniref:TadE/TadG family type IV pilus assembly protein n=1 Tax=Phytoactinopolyspora endophytica TaxID=1642495 RepID=UPI00101D82FC|nr:Tad domain-containing protein [Phytoactinopolyspora endophytica]
MTRLRRGPHRRQAERGAVSALVVVLIVMLFAVAGLVYDGGRAINARQQAFDDAEQAARAGADQIDIDLFRGSGLVRVVPERAEAEARDFLAGLPGRSYDTIVVQMTGVAAVRVVVERTVPTGLLGLVFVDSFDVRGSAVAQPDVGILGGGP